MADDLMAALRSLANRWTIKARDYARIAKEEAANEAQAAYNRGFAEGYYKAATELAAVIKDQDTRPAAPPRPAARPAQPSAAPLPPQGGRRPTQPSTPQPPAATKPSPAPTVTYASVSVGEAINILVFAGCQPRDVTQNKDNSLRATFSSWGSMMLHEQVERVQKADPRIIILNSGKLETHDYFIEFGFKGN